MCFRGVEYMCMYNLGLNNLFFRRLVSFFNYTGHTEQKMNMIMKYESEIIYIVLSLFYETAKNPLRSQNRHRWGQE